MPSRPPSRALLKMNAATTLNDSILTNASALYTPAKCTLRHESPSELCEALTASKIRDILFIGDSTIVVLE